MYNGNCHLPSCLLSLNPKNTMTLQTRSELGTLESISLRGSGLRLDRCSYTAKRRHRAPSPPAGSAGTLPPPPPMEDGLDLFSQVLVALPCWTDSCSGCSWVHPIWMVGMVLLGELELEAEWYGSPPRTTTSKLQLKYTTMITENCQKLSWMKVL